MSKSGDGKLLAGSDKRTRRADVRQIVLRDPIPRFQNECCFLIAAAWPPHSAERLRLSGKLLIKQGEAAPRQVGRRSLQTSKGICHGKAEPYRTVRRQSRIKTCRAQDRQLVHFSSTSSITRRTFPPRILSMSPSEYPRRKSSAVKFGRSATDCSSVGKAWTPSKSEPMPT